MRELILCWERATHTAALTPSVYFDNLPRADSEAARRIVTKIPVLDAHRDHSLRELVAMPRYAPPKIEESAIEEPAS